jgi:hypothetical protein
MFGNAIAPGLIEVVGSNVVQPDSVGVPGSQRDRESKGDQIDAPQAESIS